MKKYVVILIVALMLVGALAVAGIHPDKSASFDGGVSMPSFVIIANQAKLDS